jgi:protein SCO1/2
MKRPLLIIASLLVLAAAGFGAYTLGNRVGSSPSNVEIVGTAFQTPLDVSGVSLKTAGDVPVSLTDYKGKVTLVFFGFTRCPDVCPITLSRLAKLVDDLGQPDDLQVVMITVDPEFDTPDITNAYASGFHKGFVGLSGSNSEVAGVMQTFFIGAGKNTDNSIFHTDVVFVLNRDAGVKYLYGQDTMASLPSNVEALMARRDW